MGGRRGDGVTLQASGANLATPTWNLSIPASAGATFEARWETAAGASNPVVLATDLFLEVLEAEPNDDAAQGTTVVAPVS